MTNRKTIKELKKEIKKIEEKIHYLKIQTQKIENEGCLSDQELNQRDKKINANNDEILFLNKEKFSISQSISNILGKKWIKKGRFQ